MIFCVAYGQRPTKLTKSALEQRLSQNRWLLPLCWCSPDYIIRTVFTLSRLYNPEPSFTTPFVDFQRGNLHVSDYIIRKFSTISGLYNLNLSIQTWHHHPSGWMKCQNPRINLEIIFRKVFGLYNLDEKYFWKKKGAWRLYNQYIRFL